MNKNNTTFSNNILDMFKKSYSCENNWWWF